MPIYSYSRLSTFKQCPLKYKYAYIDGIARKRTSIEAFMGSRFHEVMESLYGKAPGQCPGADELKALFQRLWAEKWSEDVFSVRQDKTPEGLKAVGLRAIEDYWRRYQPFDQGRVLGLERELVIDLDDTGKYRLRCIIDRLMGAAEGAFEIHDYKTGSFLPEQRSLDEDEQLGLYEIAVRKTWPSTERVDLVWHYVAFDMEMRSSRTPALLSDLRAKTCAKIDEVEAASDFPPHESELCEWCDYQRICPLFAHRFKRESLSLEDYATDGPTGVVNRFAALDRERRELGERIKQIELEQERLKSQAVTMAEEDGVKRLYGDSHMLSIKQDIHVSYPKRGEITRPGFDAAMQGMGLWDRIVDVSWSSLKAVARDMGWKDVASVPPGLAEYLKIEPIKQVRLSKRKDLGEDE